MGSGHSHPFSLSLFQVVLLLARGFRDPSGLVLRTMHHADNNVHNCLHQIDIMHVGLEFDNGFRPGRLDCPELLDVRSLHRGGPLPSTPPWLDLTLARGYTLLEMQVAGWCSGVTAIP